MGHPSVISRTPLLRVLAPYVAGILLHEVCPRWWPPLALIALAVIGGWVLGRVSSATPSRRLRMRPYLALPLLVVALALGWLAAVIHHPPVLDAELRHSGNRVGQILDLDHTDFSTRLTVRLLDVPSATMPCRVLVTTRGCDYTLSPGDVIAWPADLEPIRRGVIPTRWIMSPICCTTKASVTASICQGAMFKSWAGPRASRPGWLR